MTRAAHATISRMVPLKKAAVLILVLAPWCAPCTLAAGETITFQAGGETVRAYVAQPADPDGRPGIVLVHHLWGLDSHTMSVADRFARLGYVVVAPDLYRGRLGTDFGLAQEMMRRLDEGRAVALVQGAIGRLRSMGGAGRRPVALVGFGMGGRVALATALQAAADVQALVIFYGHPETTPEGVMPIGAPVLGVFGTDDRAVPVEEARKFEAALKAAGKQATIIIYAGMAHAFFDDSRADHEPEMAKDAWVRTKDFLSEVLGPPQGERPAAVAPASPAGAAAAPPDR